MGFFDFLRWGKNKNEDEDDNAEASDQDVETPKYDIPNFDIRLADDIRFDMRPPSKPAPVVSPATTVYNNTKANNGAKTFVHTLLGKDQERVYSHMENTKDTIFITGKAGTGKSHLLRYFRENTEKNYVIVAPTWMAAINVGGQSIHSFFEINPNITPNIQDPKIPGLLERDTKKWRKKLLDLLKNVEVIIMDEVSMVRVDVMDMIDNKLQLANKNKLPFGGKQIIMFGDPYQLPPVVDDGNVRKYLDKHYGNEFFFSAPAFRNNPNLMKFEELSEVFRQHDDRFIGLLNKIRVGEITNSDLNFLNNTCRRVFNGPRRCLTLVPYKDAAKNINNTELGRLPGRKIKYNANISAEWPAKVDPTDRKLYLKVGALVVMLENDSGGLWHNGTLGMVTKLDQNTIRIKTTRDGPQLVVNKKYGKRENTTMILKQGNSPMTLSQHLNNIH